MIETHIDREAAWAGKPAPQIRDTARRDGSVLVQPVGSVEQHGEHLPVATDTLLADAVAHEAAERVVGDLPVLVAPPLSLGYSPHHLSFGGTISATAETFRATLEDAAASALENGFDALVLVNGHGGNRALLDVAVTTVGREHPSVEVLGLTYFELAAGFADELRQSEPGGMAHGGEFETSLALHLYPELVGDDRAATPFDEPYDLGNTDLLEGGPLSVYRGFEAYSDSGAIGDPDLASVETGASFFDRIADELADLFREVHERNR